VSPVAGRPGMWREVRACLLVCRRSWPHSPWLPSFFPKFSQSGSPTLSTFYLQLLSTTSSDTLSVHSSSSPLEQGWQLLGPPGSVFCLKSLVSHWNECCPPPGACQVLAESPPTPCGYPNWQQRPCVLLLCVAFLSIAWVRKHQSLSHVIPQSSAKELCAKDCWKILEGWGGQLQLPERGLSWEDWRLDWVLRPHETKERSCWGSNSGYPTPRKIMWLFCLITNEKVFYAKILVNSGLWETANVLGLGAEREGSGEKPEDASLPS
jgi:hypothetical protein